MKLHEYQAKELFSDYAIPVPIGFTVDKSEDAIAVAKKIPSDKWVVKSQVHAGGRGKGGGVKLTGDLKEVEAIATEMLGMQLVTYQTDDKGLPVNKVLIEEVKAIKKELYLGLVLDRDSERVAIIASTEGGVEIEKVADETPELIHTCYINPVSGFLPWQGRKMAFALGLTGDLAKQFVKILDSLVKLVKQKDLELIEINPLIINEDDDLIALDAKVEVEDNARFRQAELWKYFDASQEDSRELEAAEWDLNYVALDGQIGCMVNGAGLAMATMDIVKLYGSSPANFLDVGGTATAQRVAKAFEIILSDSKVKGIFVNIFGGIVKCDLIAQGILDAFKTSQLSLPLVVRLEGNRADLGLKLLNESGLKIVAEQDLTKAVKKIIELTS